MTSFRISTKDYAFIFSQFKSNEYVRYLFKKINNKTYKLEEYCVAYIKGSNGNFLKKRAYFIKSLKNSDMSLVFFEKIKLNDDEFCHCSKNGSTLCPECTNKSQRFKCFKCAYYKFVINKCSNKTYVDNMYKLPYIDKEKDSCGIILFKTNEDSAVTTYVNLHFKNKSTIYQLIKQLYNISELITEP